MYTLTNIIITSTKYANDRAFAYGTVHVHKKNHVICEGLTSYKVMYTHNHYKRNLQTTVIGFSMLKGQLSHADS